MMNYPLVPKQIIHALISQFILCSQHVSKMLPSSVLQIPIHFIYHKPSLLTFPWTSFTLPNIWRTTKHGDKVAKSDNASIPIHLWDLRILYMFPSSAVAHLSVLCHWIFGLQFQHLYLKFTLYICTTYANRFQQNNKGIIKISWGGIKTSHFQATSWILYLYFNRFPRDIIVGCQFLQ